MGHETFNQEVMGSNPIALTKKPMGYDEIPYREMRL